MHVPGPLINREGEMMERWYAVSDFEVLRKVAPHRSGWEFWWRDNDCDEPMGPFDSEAQALHDHLLVRIGERIGRLEKKLKTLAD